MGLACLSRPYDGLFLAGNGRFGGKPSPNIVTHRPQVTHPCFLAQVVVHRHRHHHW